MCGLLHSGLSNYVTVTLMTFDKQSNGRRIVVVTTALPVMCRMPMLRRVQSRTRRQCKIV